MLGLIRVLSMRHSVGGEPLTFEEAWLRYENWRSDPEVVLFAEPSGVEQPFAHFVGLGLVTSKNSTDAYLAAFAVAGGLRLVTFDRDFERFPGLDLLRL